MSLPANSVCSESQSGERRSVPCKAEDYVPPSPAALAELSRGLESAKNEPIVYLGSFAQYADDDE